MSLPFTCPSCGRNGRLPESFTGDRVKCPACQTISPVSRTIKDIHQVIPPEPSRPTRVPLATSPVASKPAPQPEIEDDDDETSGGRSLTPYIAAGRGDVAAALVVGLVYVLKGQRGEHSECAL